MIFLEFFGNSPEFLPEFYTHQASDSAVKVYKGILVLYFYFICQTISNIQQLLKSLIDC